MTHKTWFTAVATVLALGGPAAAQYSTVGSTPTYTTAPTYKTYGTGPRYDRVEGDATYSPALPAFSTGIELDNGTLTITGSSVGEVASVMPSGTNVVAARGSFRATYAASAVRKIVFYGNAGDDTFDNRTAIPSEAHGGDGNDILRGGSASDFLIGGLGNDSLDGNDGDDVLWGSGGHDALDGGDGDDLLKGHGGDDYLYGSYGDDALYGGSGTDELSGQEGSDTLVSIGGGTDTVVGGPSNDYFWVDTTDDVISPSTIETNEHYINAVARYYSFSYDKGATSTSVAKDLTSFDLPDPIAHNANDTRASYKDHLLFSSAGPMADDVVQGGADDCFVLGPLSAVAAQTPDSIRKLVVDLEDGTYAVRFYRVGLNAEYVRVDADLYESSAGHLRYARLGRQDSIWVPIVEKAFAFFRDKEGTYASIDGGNSGTSGAVVLGALDNDAYDIPALYDAADVISWINNGRPSGNTANYINSTVPILLSWINDRLDAGRPVYTGYVAGSTDVTTLTTSNWRRGAHIIMIDRVLFDANGNPNGLVIRDQIGPQFYTYRDFARIYHLFGRARTYDMP